jgi:DNA-binding protein H-NS
MISTATLNELQDDELRGTRGLIDEILQKRDEDCKAKAITDARAVQAKGLNDARAILEAAGLSLKDLGGSGKKKTAKGPVYHSGHTYQHPTNKTLVWSAKGKKPGWLVKIEAEGIAAVEVA